MAVTHVFGPDGEIVHDDTYAPIFVTRNTGKWSEAQLREWYTLRTRGFKEAVAQGQKFFWISDVSTIKPPDALIRKIIADLQTQHDQDFKGKDVFIGQAFIMTSTLLRGIVAAINWLSPEGNMVAPIHNVPSMEAALSACEKAYELHNLPMPSFPSNYQWPAFERF